MKITIGLILLWLVIISVTQVYFCKGQREFLKFADFVIDDNLKNVIQSGGHTYYIVDTVIADVGRDSTGCKFVIPIYVSEDELDKLQNWKRRMHIMVKEYDQMDITGKSLAAAATGYFKRKLADTQERKEQNK